MNPWFETVAEAQRRAKRRLPKSVYMALYAGSERGTTREDNMAAFAELGLSPHVIGMQPDREMATSVMGVDISLPVMISPTGVQAVTPNGEVDVAAAAANRGTAMGLSSFASRSLSDVIAANENVFFQMYWLGRDKTLELIDLAKRNNAKGLIVTTDWSFSIGRDWGSPEIPETVNAKAMLKNLPGFAVRPKWSLQWLQSVLKTGNLPDLTTPNLVTDGTPAPTFFGAYGQWMNATPPTWEDMAWLVDQYDGPVMLKGITRVDDARRAVDAGFTAISVSNHGGNNLDGTPASIRCLNPIANAVGDQIEIVLDGGVRRGSDVFKALALGARAVMIGRAYLWGLGANGQTGVENVLDLLRMGLDSAMMGTGKKSIHDITPDDVIIPDGFMRTLGTAPVAQPRLVG